MEKNRQSNFELLRVVSMFMVLALHANFKALGAPDTLEIIHTPIPACFRFFMESLCCVCVNVFVLISGWFGIKLSIKSLARFYFQLTFFSFILYFTNICIGWSQFNIFGLIACFGIEHNYWFVKAYLFLLVLAPVLNCFCSNVSREQFRCVLILFFIFQTLYGWSGSAYFIMQGYSTHSFIGLYLLSRYLRLYYGDENSTGITNKLFSARILWGGYFLISILISLIAVAGKLLNIPTNMFSYANPLIIISSVCLLLAFSKLKINNRVVNYISLSCFAVYLLHHDLNFMNRIFIPIVNKLYQMSNGIVLLLIIGIFLFTIFIVSILIDKVRIFLWNLLCKYMDGISTLRMSKIWNYKIGC